MKVSFLEQADPRLVAPAVALRLLLPVKRRRRPCGLRWGCRRRLASRKWFPPWGSRGCGAGMPILVVSAGRRPRTCNPAAWATGARGAT